MTGLGPDFDMLVISIEYQPKLPSYEALRPMLPQYKQHHVKKQKKVEQAESSGSHDVLNVNAEFGRNQNNQNGGRGGRRGNWNPRHNNRECGLLPIPQNGGQGNQPWNNQRNNNSGRQQRGPVFCQLCQRKGHTATNCWDLPTYRAAATGQRNAGNAYFVHANDDEQQQVQPGHEALAASFQNLGINDAN